MDSPVQKGVEVNDTQTGATIGESGHIIPEQGLFILTQISLLLQQFEPQEIIQPDVLDEEVELVEELDVLDVELHSHKQVFGFISQPKGQRIGPQPLELGQSHIQVLGFKLQFSGHKIETQLQINIPHPIAQPFASREGLLSYLQPGGGATQSGIGHCSQCAH